MNPFAHGGNVWQGNPGDWLDFSSNINALGCPELIRQALKEALNDISYYPDVTMQSAIEGLSRLLRVQQACILPTDGGIGALELAISTFKPKRLVSLVPAFVEYERIAKQFNIEYIPISMLKNRYVFDVPLEQIERTLKRGDMLVVCNPVNPSGFGICRSIMGDILQIVTQKKACLLVDEAFTWFCGGLSIADWIERHQNLMIAGSLTKIFAMPGVRIGYLLSYQDQIMMLKQHQRPWPLSAFAVCAAGYSSELTDFIEQTRETVKTARNRMIHRLAHLPIRIYESCANYLLIDLKPSGVTADELARGLRDSGILIRNCGNYRELGLYHIRIAIKSDGDNQMLADAMSRILCRC